MSSKVLKPGSELKGKIGDKDLGLIARWGGTNMGPDIIAPVSKGRQYQGIEGGSKHLRAAPIRTGRTYPRPSTDHTGKGYTDHHLESGQR